MTDSGESAAASGDPDVAAAALVMDLTYGLWASQTLVAAESLDLFTALSARGGATTAELCAELGIERRPADILLTACTALGLLRRDGERYLNTLPAERYLVRGTEHFFGDYVRMLRDFAYPGWMRITDAVRHNRPVRSIPDPDKGIFDSGNRPPLFWDGLYGLSAVTGAALARAVSLAQHCRLLDVGGGSGASAIELCRANPGLSATVFDLPHVCQAADRRILDADLVDRVCVCPGDFFAQPDLPGGHDVVLLSMILHDWDEILCRGLLAKCFRALDPGGMLIVNELLVSDDSSGPRDAALMSMNMLVGTGGRNYTAAEYLSWLTDAGFTDAKVVPFRAPAANGAVLAWKRSG
jgi:ubiquinone/menaquinone biosynthesis C-methylase UbiE